MKKITMWTVWTLTCLLVGCNMPPQAIEDSPSIEEKVIEEEAKEIKKEKDTSRGFPSSFIPPSKPDKLFSSNSLWNQPIPQNPEIDPRSEEMERILQWAAEDNDFVIATREWTLPVYFADENTPRHDVPLIIDWTPAPNMVFEDVPIPEGAREDPATDAKPWMVWDSEGILGDGWLTIIDIPNRMVYDLWQARQVDENGARVWSEDDRKGAKWIASWGNSISLDSDGIYPCGLSARGSGNSYPAGVIWPEELQRGYIDHKLAFSFPYNHIKGPVPPFTESDGRFSPEELQEEYESESGKSDRVYPLPEGTVLQLKPTLDLDSLTVTDPENGEQRPLRPYEKTIARAMQEYGMADVDNGGALTVYAVHPQSFEENPYEGILPMDEPYVILPADLMKHIRVLKLGPLLGEPETFLTEEQWDYYSCDGKKCLMDEVCKR